MKKRKWVMFWIKSSRGTDSQLIVNYPASALNDNIDANLRQWCRRFGAWEKSDNLVSYGWKSVKPVDARAAHRKWATLMKRESKIHQARKIAEVFVSPVKWESVTSWG